MSARTFTLEPQTIAPKTADKKYPVTVEFAGTSLIGDTAWVAMRPIVEGMGLAWQGQYDKIREDEVLASVVMQKLMTGADGKRYKMMCLPEEYLQGWLFTVNPKKVKPELREKIVQYKRQCYQVLHHAFTQRSTHAHLWRTEYLPTYHALHDTIAEKAATSSNAKYVHLNVNKAINTACGLDSGQRATASGQQAVLLMAAQMTATSALQQAPDHKTGYLACKQRLETLIHTVRALPKH